MRRYDPRQAYDLTAGCLGQIVVIEIFQLVFAHVNGGLAGIVERYELTVAAGKFELANDEGGGTSRFRHDIHRQSDRKRARYYDCRATTG